MSALILNVVFEDAGDGWVYAHVPELPEVHTQGEGLDEARVMVRDAIELVLEDRRDRGESRPRRIHSSDWMGSRRVRRDRCVKKRDLERHLSTHGCAPARRRPTTRSGRTRRPASARPRHREIKPPTAGGICRQLGVPAPTSRLSDASYASSSRTIRTV
jgi:predicted RNase H-like HicB family nuclease